MNDGATVVETVGTPRVVLVELGGDVQVEGWDRSEVSVTLDDEGVPGLEMVEGALHIHAAGDATIRVPRDAALDVPAAPGDVSIRGVHGSITLGQVAGDLALNEVGTLTVEGAAADVAIETAAGDVSLSAAGGDVAVRGAARLSLGTVGGDLAVDGLTGDLTVRVVGGDAAVRTVLGSVAVDRVGADLAVAGVGGDVRATAGGDAALDLEPRPGGSYAVTAGAAIQCRVPEGANVEVSATSGSGTVRVDAPGVPGEPVGGVYTATLGEGGSRLDLVAGSAVYFRVGRQPTDAEGWGDIGADFAVDFARWADEFAGRMRIHAVRMTERVSERLGRVAATIPDVLVAAGMSAEEAERIAERVQRAAERAAEQVQVKSERAAQHAGRQAERAERWAERQSARSAARSAPSATDRPRRPEPPAPPRRPEPPAPGGRSGASDDERLMVLRLLEEGKVTVDEAERLLNALAQRKA